MSHPIQGKVEGTLDTKIVLNFSFFVLGNNQPNTFSSPTRDWMLKVPAFLTNVFISMIYSYYID